MIKIKENVPLAPYTNYKIGGNARYFCKASNGQEIIEALEFAHKKNVPIFILGGGTNVLVSDKGFSGLVIKLQVISLKLQEDTIVVGAGTLLSGIVSFALKNGLQGLEWASGIPGTIGGAIRGNAGAFDGAVEDVVKSVRCLNIEQRELIDFTKKEIGFEYRSSLIKTTGDFIVLSATLKLKKANNIQELENAKKKTRQLIQHRKEKHPLDRPSCGSIFKNANINEIKNNKELLKNIKNDSIPAALLISKSGLGGEKIGNAQISKKHSNFIVNLGGAKAKDVMDLIKISQREVSGKFGVKLEPEVQFIGF